MRISVITASVGERRQTLYTPAVIADGIDYIAFSDRPMRVHEPWQLRRVVADAVPVLVAKRFRVLAHEYVKSDAIVWIDSKCRLTCDPREIFGQFSEHVGVLRHHRNCIYQEINACIAKQKDDPDRLRSVGQLYHGLGHPKGWGLFYGGIQFRRITPESIAFANQWWRRITEDGTYRDQISLPVVLRETGIPFHPFPRPERPNLMRICG